MRFVPGDVARPYGHARDPGRQGSGYDAPEPVDSVPRGELVAGPHHGRIPLGSGRAGPDEEDVIAVGSDLVEELSVEALPEQGEPVVQGPPVLAAAEPGVGRGVLAKVGHPAVEAEVEDAAEDPLHPLPGRRPGEVDLAVPVEEDPHPGGPAPPVGDEVPLLQPLAVQGRSLPDVGEEVRQKAEALVVQVVGERFDLGVEGAVGAVEADREDEISERGAAAVLPVLGPDRAGGDLLAA